MRSPEIGVLALTPVDGGRITYSTNSTATGQPREDVVMVAPTEAEGSRGTWIPDADYYLYTMYSADPDYTPYAYKLTSSGGVWMASMATGCSAVVYIPWRMTQEWVVVQYGSGGITLRNWQADTSSIPITFDGVSTGWFALALASVPDHDLTLMTGPYSDYTANTHWTNVAGGMFQNLPYKGYPLSTSAPPAKIEGHSLIDFSGPAYIHWTFTRCRP
jgi:hypothetical protein